MSLTNEITDHQTVLIKNEVREKDSLELREKNRNDRRDENCLSSPYFKEFKKEMTNENFEAVDIPIVIKKELDYPTMQTVHFKEELNKDPSELKEEIETSETHVCDPEMSRPIDNGNSSEEKKTKYKKNLQPDLSPKKTEDGKLYYQCDVCDKIYSYKTKLQAHKQTHESKPFECDVCKKLFPHKEAFHRHKKTHKSKRFECDICKKLFSRNEYLQEHKNTHENKRYECDVCENSFAYKRYLQAHKLTHENKRFECDVCKKSFAYKQSLQQHKKTHENKQFECGICKKFFSRNDILQKHKRTRGHKRLISNVCKKSHLHLSNLLSYKKTHKEPVGRHPDAYPDEFSNSQQLIKDRRCSFKEEPTTVISVETETCEIKTDIKQE